MTWIERLPLFPLELVLYPAENISLHIFEERYKEMIKYCLENDTEFGVILFEEGKMAQVGTTAEVAKVANEYDDGRMDIVARGRNRFRLDEISEERAYLTARVELLDEQEEELSSKLHQRAITQHMKLLEVAGREVRPGLYEDIPYLSYLIAQNAGLDAEQKQQLLEMDSENDRIRFLINHFSDLLPKIEKQESLKKKIQSNGHFKDFPQSDE